MSKPVTLAYVICTRNRSESLRSLISVLCQGISDVRDVVDVIVIDSNSCYKESIENQEIAYQFKLKYQYETVAGLSRARNRGIEIAETKFIYFLDDDVSIEKDHPTKLLRILSRNTPDLIGGPIETIFPSSIPIWYNKEWNARTHQTYEGFGAKRLSGGNFGGQLRVFREIGGFNENLGMRGDRIAIGEEREFVERYLNHSDNPRIYYAPDLKVEEPIPQSKLKFLYRFRREFANGSANIRKSSNVYENTSLISWMKQSSQAFRKKDELANASLRVVFFRRIFKLSFATGIVVRNLRWTFENRRKTKKKLVVLLYEHIPRELPSLLRLKEELVNSGLYQVVIGSVVTDLWIVKFLKPEFCVIPYFYDLETDVTADTIQSLKETTFISLSWEQIFYPAKVSSKLPKDPPDNVVLLCWTKTWMKTIAESIEKKSRIIHLGHPVWSSLAVDEEQTFDLKGNVILYIENSSIVFTKRSTLTKLTNRPDEVKKYFQELLKQNLYLLDHAQKSGKYNIVIRVRPSTPLESFISFASLAVPDNAFRFVKGNALKQDLAKSALVLTEMSTSIIECALRGKPCALLHSRPIPIQFRYSWFKFFHKITKREEIQKCFTDKSNLRSQRLRNWLETQGAINSNYFTDFLALLNSTPVYSPQLFRQMNRRYQRFLVHTWQSFLSIDLFRHFVIRRRGKFSVQSHEADYLKPSEYNNYDSRSSEITP
jgi:glycosyltransferase involved in cell wall biosynthesis